MKNRVEDLHQVPPQLRQFYRPAEVGDGFELTSALQALNKAGNDFHSPAATKVPRSQRLQYAKEIAAGAVIIDPNS